MRSLSHPLSRSHDRLAVVLASIVPLSAIPLASNRASLWLFWTGLFALLAIYHLLQTLRLAPGRAPAFIRFRVAFALALLIPLWALLQTLPVVPLLPQGSLGMRQGLGDLVGSSISVQADIAGAGVLRFMGYILLLALVLEVSTRRERVLRLAQIIFAGVVLQAIWAIVALKFMDDFSFLGTKTTYAGVATGSFVNRNSLATFLGFGSILGIGILVERAGKSQMTRDSFAKLGFGDAFILLGILVQMVAILATQSRLGLAATLLAILVTLLLARKHAGSRPKHLFYWAVFLLLAAGTGMALLAGGDGIASRLLFAQAEGQTRLSLYSQTLGMIAQRPLAGYGMDGFGIAFEAFRAPPLLGQGNFDLAHNSYLMLWAEFGVIIGSIPPLLMFYAAIKLWRQVSAPYGFSGLALAGIGVVVLGAVHSLGDFSLEIPANVYLFLTIIGLGLGQRTARKTNAVPPFALAATVGDAR